ncbi:glycoside hydrolase family 36 N-terminal domain-containing protein, partial [Streptococcus pneumoniae]|nr:glycoside hydrolase family 36 N-terminal domain-containing protein [Streptococcus pneumoniae]
IGQCAETLTIILTDSILDLTVRLNYTIFPEYNVLVRNTEFLNNSNNKLTLLKAMSLQLDLPDSQYDFIQFSGAWLRERQLYRTSLRPG